MSTPSPGKGRGWQDVILWADGAPRHRPESPIEPFARLEVTRLRLDLAPDDPRRLVLLSFLMLFLELALIRWLGENVLYLSFFTNFVLLASFLGIGLGFLVAGSARNWILWLPYGLLGLIGFVIVFPVTIDRSATDVLFFGQGAPTGVPIWVSLPAIFLAVTALFAIVGQEVATVFARFGPLRAYRLDIVGSLLGVIAFSGVALLRLPPVGWASLVAFLVAGLAGRRLRGPHLVALAGVVVILGVQSLRPGTSWSPYYRVTVTHEEPLIAIGVNGIPHQAIASTAYLRSVDWIAVEPYKLLPDEPLDRVLVVGAGNGVDVALALEEGARHVDAVEIDPVIHEIGLALNPGRPYQDPRVAVHIDDGRAFLHRAGGSYDLIVFALPDSLTLISGQSNLRLESFLFTREAIAEARALLAPDGVFAMYNFYREQWLVDRLARTLSETFGGNPCIVRSSEVATAAMLAAGPGVAARCPVEVQASVAAPVPSTDDHPFLYVREREIPGLYLVVLAAILAASLAAVRVAMLLRPRDTGGLGSYLDLFLLGAAFLLLETKSVVQFALWFGTTWTVNALVFAGILVTVLAAIEISRRIEVRLPILYGLLFGSLLVAWIVPAGALLALPGAPRWVAATLVTFTPILAANLVFAARFRATAASTTAFGANLLGAMVGGTLEYLSLITGYQALLMVVAALYAGAFVAWARRGIDQPAAASVSLTTRAPSS